MTTPSPTPVTDLLTAVGHGDASAHDRLWALIYDELHALAQHQLAGDAVGRVRQPTSLVHEAYLRLTAGQEVEWANRRHFFGAAAQAMRRIRIDDARKRDRLKRGGGRQPEALDEASVPHPSLREGWGTPGFDEDPAELLALHEALTRLEQRDPRKAEVVSLRYFAGLTIDETAQAMGVSPRTVDSEWRFAKAWLHKELSSE